MKGIIQAAGAAMLALTLGGCAVQGMESIESTVAPTQSVTVAPTATPSPAPTNTPAPTREPMPVRVE